VPDLDQRIEANTLHMALQHQAAWHAAQDPLQVTHPATCDRLQALGLSVDRLDVPAVPPDQAAGPVWWQSGWAERLAAENTRWRRQHGRAWRNQASWRAACSAQLDGRDVVGEGSALECLLAMGRTPEATGLPEEPNGQPPLDAYWIGAAWLPHDPARALRWLEAAIAACVALAAPARRCLLEAANPAPTPTERERQQRLLAQAVQRRDDARSRAEDLGMAAGHAVEADDWRRSALVEALSDDAAVRRAAWVQHEVALASGRQYSVVTLCLQIRLDGAVPETGIAQDYAGLLAQVVTPARVGSVRTWWTTEDWPPALDGDDSHVLKAATG
jgi:hypothetical protein